MWQRIIDFRTVAPGESFTVDVAGLSFIAFSVFVSSGWRHVEIVPADNVWICYQKTSSEWGYLIGSVSNGVMTVSNPSDSGVTVNIHGVFSVA